MEYSAVCIPSWPWCGYVYLGCFRQCSYIFYTGIYILFGLWMLALVFVSIFIELSISSKAPRYLGPFHPSSASNLIVRTSLLIITLFFGLGQFYCILKTYPFVVRNWHKPDVDKMVHGDTYKQCMPYGVADFVMLNFISQLHIAVQRILFNHNFHPERAV